MGVQADGGGPGDAGGASDAGFVFEFDGQAYCCDPGGGAAPVSCAREYSWTCGPFGCFEGECSAVGMACEFPDGGGGMIETCP